ncbi:MAG: HAD-IIB family hydrolase [Planctomycetaceae bacterium]|nr:HAD-IIB family hydrolase [Planctomycetales bacterium]MCB9925764.1 HAD-IIB family hydrolase [Planctomycetaceae bacterium]
MTDGKSDSGLHIVLISLHGLIRANDPELGRDADTGGQVKYVLELAAELGKHTDVRHVELITRQIFDDRVGPDYAKLEETIAENAKIVRIPFGPKRYLKKEALWPYMEAFIDQTLSYFRRTGLPHLIHGHYADAGYGGAQLARLLHLPFVFTGHSLGRVKKQRLLDSDSEAKDLEETYRFTTRAEAEEMAIETASLIVTSTNQEVEQQYEVYEAYMPERMEVIPPGVDLTAFYPPKDDEPRPRIADALAPFLKNAEKPMILTLARPDDRKNLEALVRVYGGSSELQQRANLVMLLGTRDDLRELAPGQRRVLLNILTLIDVYNLYGKVAYPKTHLPTDVSALYRLATSLRGVFINPALTEPFGLTLLEAAASGLPLVATNDGGPRDIIANCKNGLLVDPLDDDAIEKALLRALTEPQQWETWSANGISGTREHYSWKHHVDRYLRDVIEIVEAATEPALAEGKKQRRIPQFDRLIVTDLDNTLTGDDQALAEFTELLRGQGDNVGFGIATGRRLDDALEMIKQLRLPMPDLLSTSVGTELHYGESLTPDRSWHKQIAFQWKPDEVQKVLADVEGLFPQSDKEQSTYKVSYKIDPKTAPKIGAIRRILREAGLRVKAVLSLEIYLDIIPVRGGDELAIRHLLYKWGFSPEQVLVVGDSGNDEGMLKGRTLGVVVGNYSPELEKLRKLPRIYFAEAAHARGIIEGVNYYHFLDRITIPNDRIE